MFNFLLMIGVSSVLGFFLLLSFLLLCSVYILFVEDRK
jgi:hypothetical protein